MVTACSEGSASASSMRIGVQALRPTQHGGQRLDGHAHHVVLRLLGGQRNAGGLRVEAQQPGARVLRLEGLAHLARPDAPRGAVLGDLFEEVVVGIEEEGQPRREVIDLHAALRCPSARTRARLPA